MTQTSSGIMSNAKTTTASPTPIAAAWFARCRKFVSWLVALAFIGLLIFTISPGSPANILVMEIGGMLLISAAVLGRIWCALYIAGRKNVELCRDGPYSVCRNPLYVFSFFGAVGFTLVARSEPLALALILVFTVYHHFVIRAEEARLREIFGVEYDDYCAVVPRVWPRLKLHWSRSSLVIDPRVVGKAILAAAWFLIALCGYEVIEHYRGASLEAGRIPTIFTWAF